MPNGMPGGWTSTEPMSGAPPNDRKNPNPRWSKITPGVGTPASISGLPACGARVRVGPPLSASGPSSGSPDRVPTPDHPVVGSTEKKVLVPVPASGPVPTHARSGLDVFPTFSAMTESTTVRNPYPDPPTPPPPPDVGEVLPVMVEFRMVAAPEKLDRFRPAPPFELDVVLSAIVLLSISIPKAPAGP